jgi:hypothetical protein
LARRQEKEAVEMSKRKPVAMIHNDGRDIFVSIDGVNIAKRGAHNMPQAKTWVSLEPGWSVIDIGGGRQIEVRHQGVVIH